MQRIALGGVVCVALFTLSASVALAAGPFGDSFDSYSLGNLYSQGLWQNHVHTWNVTNDGCESGTCITSTGANGDNYKSGDDLPVGEWHFSLNLASNPFPDYVGPLFYFGSALYPQQSGFAIRGDSSNTFQIVDNRGNAVGSRLVLGTWHQFEYRWDMSDPHNCTFTVSVDGGPATTSAPSSGDPSNCYNNVYAEHTIGSIDFSNYFSGQNELRIDTIGDGPIVDGCMTNCDGTTSPQISDSFDHFNDKGWVAPASDFNRLRLGVLDDGSTGDCHSGGCLRADGSSGGFGGGGWATVMYLESGVARPSGAFTIWAKAETAWQHVSANIGLCAGPWSDCTAPDPYYFNDIAPNDAVWHQYYMAWRQSDASVESCLLQDDTDTSRCVWKETSFPLGTQIDGIQINTGVGRPDLGEHIWFDDLADASVPTTPACSENCNDNVMFLPGIESSRLYRITSSGEQKLWEPSSDADAAQLAMNPDGTSLNGDIYARGIIDSAYVPDFGNVYTSFIDDMNGLVSSGAISEWEPIAYDWRYSLDQILSSGNLIGPDGSVSYSVATSSPYIIQELKKLASTSRTGKVTIIAHSNGGLVAKALMIKLGPDAAKYVDKIILVSSPQVGTPSAIGAMLHGADQGFQVLMQTKLTPNAARTLGDEMPGAYGLLPSADYFTYIDDPVVTFDSTTMPDWASTYGDTIHSAAGEHTYFADTPHFRQNPPSNDLVDPAILSDSFLTQAEQMHQQLDSWTPPQGVKVIQIAGWGVPTLSGIDYKKVTVTNNLGTITQIETDARQTIDGDGTVLVPSSLWISTSTGAEDYWVNLESYNRDHQVSTGFGHFNFEHRNILEVDNLRIFISDLLANKTTAISNYAYLTDVSPTSTKVRLLYALHSPLTLNLYDNQGRHTGISTSTGQIEEQIPGTYYSEFGDVKYVFTNADIPVHIVMNGYATSTFTFNVQQLQGDTVTASTTWLSMPVTPTTKVTLDTPADITTISPMHIDANGDGLDDVVIKPSSNGTATIKYQFGGFLQPINDTAHQAGASLSIFKAGSTVPVKFQLTDLSGKLVQASSMPTWLAPVRGSLLATVVNDTATSTTASSGSLYKWDGSQYVYNWSTKGLAAGYWYTIYAALDDGTIYSVRVGLK